MIACRRLCRCPYERQRSNRWAHELTLSVDLCGYVHTDAASLSTRYNSGVISSYFYKYAASAESKKNRMNFLQTGVFCCSLTNIDKIQTVVAKRYCMCNCVWLAVCLISSVKMTDWLSFITRISAIADGPRDSTCQSNSCQLQHNNLYDKSRTNRSNGVRGLQSTNV